MTEFTPIVLDTHEHGWRVRCQGEGCDRAVDVPRRTFSSAGTVTRDAPQARGCIDHPPNTWVHKEA